MTKISITTHSSGNGFEIQFKNGSLIVPDQQKAYIISSGCGAGKTWSIQLLIDKMADKGIMYCVDTISEVDKMYDWILKNTSIKEQYILRLHSGEKARDDLEEYWENPEKIMTKKVILLTHIRFWTDLINYFLIYKPTVPVPTFDGDFQKLTARDDLRQYVIFDETPNFFKPFAIISRTLLGCFAEKTTSGKWQCKGKTDLIESYNEFVSGTSLDLTNKSHKRGRVKNEVILECIPKYFDEWIESRESEHKIFFYPRDLCQDVIKTHILIYEGAGEVLLNGTSRFELLNIENKYNSVVKFHEIPEPQERRKRYDDVKFNDMISSIVGILNGRKHTQTLIVVWKDIGKKNNDEGSGESKWVKKIDDALSLKGVSETHYSITYFGASNTKSTNDYRDFSGIILVGYWNVPNTFPESIRRAFISETSLEDYRLWYYVQLISRIGIRYLDGGEFDVWYTSDYSKDFINCLDEYFNKNIYNLDKFSDENWLNGLAKTKSIRNGQVTDIKILAKYDPSLKDSILSRQKVNFSISLRVLYSLCRKSEKKRKSYIPLENALLKLGITLTIT